MWAEKIRNLCFFSGYFDIDRIYIGGFQNLMLLQLIGSDFNPISKILIKLITSRKGAKKKRNLEKKYSKGFHTNNGLIGTHSSFGSHLSKEILVCSGVDVF